MTSENPYLVDVLLSASCAARVDNTLTTEARQRVRHTHTEAAPVRIPAKVRTGTKHFSRTNANDRFTPFIQDIIWEVRVLDQDEARMVCTAALDWNGATDSQIADAKHTMTKAVFGYAEDNFVGSVEVDFAIISHNEEKIFAVFGAVDGACIHIDSPVTIFYGHFAAYKELYLDGYLTWRVFCKFEMLGSGEDYKRRSNSGDHYKGRYK